MTTTPAQCEAARGKLHQLVSEVCGSCEKSCCHHGTMMGSRDLLRLRKGMLVSPEFARRFFDGLGRRLAEIEADIAQLWELCDIIDATQQVSTKRLRASLAEWEAYCADARAIESPDMESLKALLLFSAKRARALREVREVPGAPDVLQVMGARPALRFHGRRLPADRCLFDYDGCLAEEWKPAKCAGFFCPVDPGLMATIFDTMEFDEFVRANVRALPAAELVQLVELEAQLGDEYLSSKVIFAGPTVTGHIIDALHANGVACQVQSYSGSLMLSRRELLTVTARWRGGLGILTCDAVSGSALYEIAMAADELAREQSGRAWYVVARRLVSSSRLTHPLWQDRSMSQPVGALEMYVVSGDRRQEAGGS